MARLNGVDDMSLKDLTDLLHRVEQALAARKQADRTETKAKMLALAAEAGFSVGGQYLATISGERSIPAGLAVRPSRFLLS